MLVACFDIGGTAIKSALIGDDKEIRERQEIATPATLEELLEWMDKVIRSSAQVTAISLSVPGAVDQENGNIKGLSAVPYIHGPSWYQLLATYQLPIYLENDANCVGLSELAIDSEIQNMACLVCGTGLGGALIIDRKVVRGKKGYGGEFGYMLLEGLTSPVKNWSQLASTGSLVRQAARLHQADPSEWNGKKVFKSASLGDRLSQEAISRMIENLTIGLLNLYYIVEPEVIAIGGSISQNVEFIELLQQRLQQVLLTYPDDIPEIPAIRACHYTQDANLMGAYVNALAKA